MTSFGYTYKKPDEEEYVRGLIAYLISKGENAVADLLKGSKCAIQPSNTYSRSKGFVYQTSVYFQILPDKLASVTDETKQKLAKFCEDTMPPEVGFEVVEVDFSPLLGKPSEAQEGSIKERRELSEAVKTGNRVFVVHGHDDDAKQELELFLKELGLDPIVLHRKPDQGHTIIEKFEKYSDVSYAFVLLTPDDVGYSKSEETKPDEKRIKELRARQNVIFEFGYFVGSVGRGRVCCLHKPGVSLPTDVSGVLYKELTGNVVSLGYEIMKELKAAGFVLN